MRTEDGYIINKCLNEEPAAFGLLVEKYKSGIYALAYAKLGNFHDAEDITQEVFLKAYQKLRTLRQGGNFHAWLYAITSNLCKNFLRSRARRPDGEFIADQDAKTAAYSAMAAHHKELLHESLHEALEALPEIHRQVLTLYYLGGMSSKEIAQFLGTSPSTINMRLSRARAQLKEEMLAMMDTTFEEQRLQPSFTLRIVEMIKQTKIQPVPRTTWTPWGISLGTALILPLLFVTPSLIPIRSLIGAPPIPSETQVAEMGEIPVDVVKLSEISIFASERGNGEFGRGKNHPDPQHAFAPPGEARQRADMKIAFESNRDGNWEIYVMNTDGSNPVNLTQNKAKDRLPSWSPDRTRIAFTSTRSGSTEIHVMNANGTDPVVLTSQIGLNTHPHWSPEGKKIVFASIRGTNSEIYVMNANGKNLVKLTDHPTYDWYPSWSPDGRKIAFMSSRDGNQDVYVMNTDGTQLVNLTNHPASENGPPAWSPDATKIAFWSNRDGNFEIYVMNADGSHPIRLTRHPAFDRDPAWSSDGMKIVFASDRAGNFEIYMMNADGSHPNRLTKSPGDDLSPVWSPAPSLAVSPQEKLPTQWGEVKRHP